MGYIKNSVPQRKKKMGLLGALKLLAFGDDGPSGASCQAYDASGNCVSVSASDTGINYTQDSGGVSTSGTAQDTTVLPSGAVVGGQGTGIPTAPPVTGDWVNKNGVCYATSSSFLGTLKDLQRAANRCADAMNPPAAKIGVDGAIGPGTLGLMSTIAKQGAFSGLAQPTLTCYNVCQYASAFTAAMDAWADAKGAASSVSSPAPAISPQVYNPKTGQLENQNVVASATDLWNNMSSSEQGIALGAVAALGYWAYTDKKKRRK